MDSTNLNTINKVSDLEYFFKQKMKKYFKDFTLINEKVYMPVNKAIYFSLELVVDERLFWYARNKNHQIVWETLN